MLNKEVRGINQLECSGKNARVGVLEPVFLNIFTSSTSFCIIKNGKHRLTADWDS